MTDYDHLDRLARQQLGHVTSRQLALSLTRRQRQVLVRTGRVVRVRHGVYRLCGVQPTWRSMAMAAVLAAGGSALLSHRSAAILWGLLDQHAEEGPLELTAALPRLLEGVVTHRHRLTPAEVTKRFGIPVTTAARTLIDLGESVRDGRELGGLVDDALRRRLVTVGQLRHAAQAHAGSGRRFQDSIRAALADRIPGYDPGANAWEQRMDRMWEQLGLPAAARQYRIRSGNRSYRPDRAIVDLKIAVDWNGYVAHGSRTQFDYDSDRRARLASIGWYPLDFTSKSSPLLICQTVLAVVGERRAVVRSRSGPAGPTMPRRQDSVLTPAMMRAARPAPATSP